MGREPVVPSRVGASPADDHVPLIRNSHIVSSAVREVLGSKLMQELTDEDITPRQLQLLTFVAIARHHIEEVAQFLEVTPPAATRAVDALERRGLVQRTPSATDRRLKVLCCSEKGRRLVARYRSLQASRIETVVAGFTPEDIRQLSDLLERYARALVESDPRPEAYCLRCGGYFDADCPLQALCSTCGCRPRRKSDDR